MLLASRLPKLRSNPITSTSRTTLKSREMTLAMVQKAGKYALRPAGEVGCLDEVGRSSITST